MKPKRLGPQGGCENEERASLESGRNPSQRILWGLSSLTLELRQASCVHMCDTKFGLPRYDMSGPRKGDKCLPSGFL